ncbi:hypothetical protein CCMSSC00406_0006870 [Pleurotus cornucopiae]|uniref:Uncharacterized protein n=1 Tax=Pleurotus cornucopiae TaxID=5321 RepID=A0ACB7INZ6_PLECO|nr:hypothetical protein CCMSSC00406_0006870 [Pleurotus cornucopiae]
MVAPRLSQSAEAARAAAQQAEFNEKKWVWVPDDKEGYAAGWISKTEGDMGDIVLSSGGEIRRVPLYALSKMNPPKFDRVEDIADLTFLNEASVVHNLRLRYGSGAIYTYSGLFLVAINPYQNLPLYSDAIVQQYRGRRRDENPPHIFAVAERAWVNMGDERENQSILITGESGAGKTESTKKVIQYLAAIATDAHLPSTPSHSRSPTVAPSSSFGAMMPASGLPRNSSFKRSGHTASPSTSGSGSHMTAKDRLGLLERQILQANPILEAFGNAQTQRNNNSSRFGKFVRIMFSPDGSIAGAYIDWYLLEKSRVVARSEAERSFHVFYQLMAGGGRQFKESLLLDGGIEDYGYLNQSRREVDGVDDKEEWSHLKSALDIVGFSPAEQFDLFRVVAAIMHIGNITVTSTRSDDALMPNPSQVERVCHLLGIPVAEFTRAILRPSVLAGREWVSQARTQQQALDELASLCKTLYEKTFGLLVDRINRALDRPSSKSTFIGVLDIAGFEIFDVNGYEQLLINYTNEKLQQFFNHHMFVLEQEEYSREGIEWDYVNFGLDLQPTIDLIEANGGSIGILSCLDDQCIMPKATDATFTHKLHQMWGTEVDESKYHPGMDKYEPTRFEQGFIVQHYAGKVEYRTDGWLDKNKDPLNDNITRVLAASGERFVASLFADYDDLPAPGTTQNMFTVGKRRVLKKGAFRTVGQRHKEQLASLMSQLHSTQPHFVRCIVPNTNKKPARVDVPLILDQLRCNGVLEGIRIARLGYPNRLPFVEFRQRYEVLTPGIIPRGYMDGRKACLLMVDALDLDRTIYRVGTSKIFFKAGVLAALEERRDALLYEIFSRLQAVARMYTARRQMKKILNRAVAIRTIQKNARIYGELRDWPWWQLYTKVRPLLAATRNDDELRKKEAELALIRERAERDKQEKEALETLKMSLETEKRRVEDELEAERAVGLEKDAILDRSKHKEAELEEEITALQSYLETQDRHLDDIRKMQKEKDGTHELLKQAFEQAAEHLVRLENEQQEWVKREEQLVEELREHHEHLQALQADHEELTKVSEDLQSLVIQREEDLARAKERTEALVAELEGKLGVEHKNREAMKSKVDALEQEVHQTKEQLTELTRTATEYSSMLQKKEERIVQLLDQLDTIKAERDSSSKQVIELQSDIDTLMAELDAGKLDKERSAAARTKLEEELDDLRALMQAKTSEESKRLEVEKSREEELAELRRQASTLQQELSESRRLAAETQNKLKVELDHISRDHHSLERSHQSLLDRERAAQAELTKAQASVAELEKSKRAAESELQAVRTRQANTDNELSTTLKSKTDLERQLVAIQSRRDELEDSFMEAEREKLTHLRHLEAAKKSLESENKKSAQLEKTIATMKSELATLKDQNVKLDRDLNKALKDVKDREWEIKKFESRQDKITVEHIHVYEKVKRATDRELQNLKQELQQNETYIRSLERMRDQLKTEAEDLERRTQQESLELRSKDKAVKSSEDKAARAQVDLETERKAKELAEMRAKKLESDLKAAQDQLVELSQEVLAAQRSKDNLEMELMRIADETETPNSVARAHREYQSRIAQLEGQLEEAESGRETSDKIREVMERQHAEIRQLILSHNPNDQGFQSRLLEELQHTEDRLSKEMNGRTQNLKANRKLDFTTMTNVTPTKATPKRVRTESLPDPAPRPDPQVGALKQQVQTLEIQMAASDRIRRHLESAIRDMLAELERSDDSKQSLQNYRQRLTNENTRLTELLHEESEARRAAEAAQIDGVQAMWNKFQNTITEERESYARLEESRKALVVQQRTAQAEIESQRAQLREASSSKKQLQSELSQLQQEVAVAKNEASAAKRQLQKRLQEDEISSTTSSAAQLELRAVIETYQAKEGEYRSKLEAAEIARAKAARAEAHARRSLTDMEKTHAQAVEERNASEARLQATEKKLRELENKFEEENREATDLSLLHQRLVEELQDERKQHQEDLKTRDFTADQVQKKYQAELAQLSEELQSQRESISRLREDNRKIRSDYDQLLFDYNNESSSIGGWKKEKERMETKIEDLNKAYTASESAQAEQQAQIVALHSQVRELRSVLNDAEAERTMLQKARRALQAELESIKLDYVDTNKMSSDRELQKLQLKKQDLERALDEQEDHVKQALDRMKEKEAYAAKCQAELYQLQEENSALEKLNANLDKQVKELNVRVVDLETKSYTNSPRSTISTRRAESKIEELTNQLHQSGKEKSENSRSLRAADKLARDAKLQIVESDRQRQKLEEERKAYENQIEDLRKAMDKMQTEESTLQAMKRRAEREAGDFRQKTLTLEREVERLRSRLDRPTSSLLDSPSSSPRK